jgi:hypothetical protein
VVGTTLVVEIIQTGVIYPVMEIIPMVIIPVMEIIPVVIIPVVG